MITLHSCQGSQGDPRGRPRNLALYTLCMEQAEQIQVDRRGFSATDPGDELQRAFQDVVRDAEQEEVALPGKLAQERQQENQDQNGELSIRRRFREADGLFAWQQAIDDLVAIERVKRDEIEDGQAEIDAGK